MPCLSGCSFSTSQRKLVESTFCTFASVKASSAEKWRRARSLEHQRPQVVSCELSDVDTKRIPCRASVSAFRDQGRLFGLLKCMLMGEA